MNECMTSWATTARTAPSGPSTTIWSSVQTNTWLGRSTAVGTPSRTASASKVIDASARTIRGSSAMTDAGSSPVYHSVNVSADAVSDPASLPDAAAARLPVLRKTVVDPGVGAAAGADRASSVGAARTARTGSTTGAALGGAMLSRSR
jgi:hypothetical protein